MAYTAEEEDFLRRNPGDEHRMNEALSNYTGDRDFDSQGPMYDQRTNQLSPAGVAATARLRAQPRPMAAPFTDVRAAMSNPNAYLMPHGVQRQQPRTLGEMTGLIDPRYWGGR